MTKSWQKITVFVIMAAILIAVFLPTFAYAESTIMPSGYTDVLYDLNLSKNFQAEDFPVNATDYSMQLITVAESVNRQLFVYVYQPSAETTNLTAKTINISTGVGEDLNYENYTLAFMGSNSVFQKYRVQGITVSDSETRYYDITQLMREPHEEFQEDILLDNNNTVQEIPFEVAKQFVFTTASNVTTISMYDLDVIHVTDKYVGFVRYKDGYHVYNNTWTWFDSHFVAFDTDFPVDNLLEADVFYTYQSHSLRFNGSGSPIYRFGTVNDGHSYLNGETESFAGSGLFSGSYEWKNIATVDEFLAENDVVTKIYSGALLNVSVANKITEEGLQDLQGKKWVLRFAATEVSEYGGQSDYEKKSTLVGGVMILRLKFESNGTVYNLGVVDNKQSGDGKPDNIEKVEFEPTDLLELILLIVLLILLFTVGWPVIQIIAKLLKIAFKAVWLLLTLPIRGIKRLSGRRKKRR